jgi:hypothetical protein
MAASVEAYLQALPADRQAGLRELRMRIAAALPAGFEECISYGMPAWVVPHRLYPAGYHCDPKLPLPFLSLAAQKASINLYHLGLYADAGLLAWFQTEHAKASPRKLDMGKSCIRYKKAEDIPMPLIEQLLGKLRPADWIRLYEAQLKR